MANPKYMEVDFMAEGIMIAIGTDEPHADDEQIIFLKRADAASLAKTLAKWIVTKNEFKSVHPRWTLGNSEK